MSKKIWLWSFVNAAGTLVYISLVALIMSNGEAIFGNDNVNKWAGPVAILLLFVLSAAITAALVLGRPIWWYLAGAKSDSWKLFFGTLAWLVIFLVIFILSNLIWRAPVLAPGVGV